MSATVIRQKRQTTLPIDVVEAAGLKVNDQVEWRFEGGEIRGRKLEAKASEPAFPPGSLLKYFTREKNAEELALLAGCVTEPEE